MGDTAISWTNKTWNPIRGCSRVSEGCRHCYAEQQAARIVRMGKGKPTAYDGLVKTVIRKGPPDEDGVEYDVRESRWTGEVRLVPEHLSDPLKWCKPQLIFANSMSDLFHEKLTNEQIAAVFGVMAACPQHTFQVLTKRAKRMREWFAWATRDHYPKRGQAGVGPHVRDSMQRYALDALSDVGGIPVNRDMKWPLPNVHLGVSVENQDAADERIPELLEIPAAVHWISAEPLLGPVNMSLPNTWLVGATARKILRDHGARGPVPAHLSPPPSIDWVVTGAESGSGARPCDVEWLRSLRDQCAAAGVPFFLKQAVEESEGGDSTYPSARAARTPVRTVIAAGPGSKRKPNGLIELPYLDGVQHAAFPGPQ